MSKTNSIYRAISLLTAAGLFASLCSCADEVEPAEVSETTTRVWIPRQTGAGAWGLDFAPNRRRGTSGNI